MAYNARQTDSTNYVAWWLTISSAILAAMLLNSLITFAIVREYIKSSFKPPAKIEQTR